MMATRTGVGATVVAVLLALSACQERPAASAPTQRDIDAAAQKTKDAAIAAGHKAADLADKARDNTRDYFKSPQVQKDMANAKEAVKDALDGRKAPSPDDAARK